MRDLIRWSEIKDGCGNMKYVSQLRDLIMDVSLLVLSINGHKKGQVTSLTQSGACQEVVLEWESYAHHVNELPDEEDS